MRATRGKYVRAEPVSALYEQGKIHHVGTFSTLEDQMVTFIPSSGSTRDGEGSPDRVDALVWALTELFPSIIMPARDPEKWRRTQQDHQNWLYNSGKNKVTGY